MNGVAARIGMTRERVRAALGAGGGYFVLAATTIELTSNGRNHATVWPADALILALLLNAPRRLWPAIVMAGWIGNALANGAVRGWMAGIVLYGAINMAQTLFAALLLGRVARGANLLEDMRATGRFLLFAGCLAPALGAAAGAIASLLNYGEPLGPSFLRWFSSTALGLLIGTPFLQAVFDGTYRRAFAAGNGKRRLEMIALLAGHAALTALVFAQSRLPLLFLPYSSLLLLSFRLGRAGTFVGVALIALAGAIAAYCNVGPMALLHQGPFFESLFFQGYLGVILCTALPVAATVASRQEALRELAGHRTALQQMLRHSPDGILSFDETGICRWADGPLREFTGLQPHDFVGRTLAQVAEHTSMELLSLAQAARNPDDATPTCDFASRLTPDRTLEASIGVVMQGEERTGLVITLRDISVRASREAAISRMAETDDLTGAFNRKGFRSRLTDAVEARRMPVTLALIDVDHFKAINDTFGHSVGDRLLAGVAARLSASIRNGDVVGRLGGDEFAILFDCDVETARMVCERIAESLRRLPVLDETAFNLTVSISCGIAQLRPGMTRGEFYDMADVALYEVKRAGRDGVRAAA